MNQTTHDEFVRLSAAIRESRAQRRLAVTYCREARYQLSFQAHHLAAAELAAAMEHTRVLLQAKAQRVAQGPMDS